MMTMKAQELGMAHSRFVNANGLPDSRQITSARDIATLSRAVLRDYPQYYGYFSQEQFVFRGQVMNNHNGLLGRMPGVDGLKTGFTNAAGFNLAASAVRNGNRLIAVVLGGSSGAARNANVEDLLLTGFDVEDRRARGETLLLTQNLLETPPASSPAPLQVEQGDADADPIDVVLTGAVTGRPVTILPAGATRLAAQRAIAARPAAPAAQASGPAAIARNWTVAVGSFRTDRQATRQVDYIADTFGVLFDDREGSVSRTGHDFHSVFTGFTQAEAQSACAEVTAKNLPCQAVGPR